MKRLILPSKGEFSGQFTICDEDVDGKQYKYSIGDYLELVLLDPPFLDSEIAKVLDRVGGVEEAQVTQFPLRIQFSSELRPFECSILVVEGRVQQHWQDCLTVGQVHVVVPLKFEHKQYVWYMPEIDNWRPGLSGKVKH